MRFIRWGLVIVLLLGVAACGNRIPEAEKLMPAVNYQGVLNKKTKKVAYLTWHHEKVIGSLPPTFVSPSTGVAGAIVGTAITHYQQNKNKNDYLYKYGTAQQAVFMTSLRDVLVNDQVFKQVHLVVNPPNKLKSNDLLIDVDFTKTAVTNIQDNYPTTIDVVLTITKANQKPIKRTIKVKTESSFWKHFWSQDYVKVQTAVSRKLMKKTLNTIVEQV